VYHVFFVNAIAVRALDLHPDSPQFRQLKIYFKGISVTLVHQKGVKKIRGLVCHACPPEGR
jgi:eukaryotic translation initiation factor 2C